MVTDNARLKADIFKALAHPVRIAVVEMLAKKEMSVSDLSKKLDTKGANTSQHLTILRSAGILKTRKDGLNVYYSLAMPCMVNMLRCVNETLTTQARNRQKMAKDVIRRQKDY